MGLLEGWEQYLGWGNWIRTIIDNELLPWLQTPLSEQLNKYEL